MSKDKTLRTCIQSREKLPKHELLRFVFDSENTILKLDETGKAQGRGANLKPDLDVFDQAVNSGAFSRALKVNIDKESGFTQARADMERHLARKQLADDSGTVKIRVKKNDIKLN